MARTLREFIVELERRGELARVRAPVSPVLEITEIADRVSKSRAARDPGPAAKRDDPRFFDRGGHALLFENVTLPDGFGPSAFPVLINAWGSYSRMELALGCEGRGFEFIAGRLAELTKPQPPHSLAEALDKLRLLAPLLKIPPKRLRGGGPCQEVVITGDRIDLRTLPIIKCWPLDGDFAALGYPPDINDGVPGVPPRDGSFTRGRYITLGGIHTIHARDRDAEKPASHNIGMYRVQLLGPRTMAMHWHMHHDGAAHWRSWKGLGKPMPVVIALGGEAVMPYAATCPLPPGISELLMAGFLSGRGIELCRAKTVPLWAPANAEIVIEGWVRSEAGGIGWDPRKREERNVKSEHEDSALGPGAVFEGPFGDHTGFYSLPDRYPLLEVTAITHRRSAIYPATIVGLPPQEDYYLGKATERIMLPLLKTIIHDIEDYDLPMFGAFHNCAFVRIDKQYPLHARRVMHAVWGAGQMSWTKTIVAVDKGVDVHDHAAVLRAAGERCVPARDIEMVRGPIDILDHASPFLGGGTKMGLDATEKHPGAETHREPGDLAARLCAAGPIEAALGERARAAEARVRQVPGVLDARIPDELGGWWLLIRAEKKQPGDGARIIKAIGGLADEIALPRWTVVVGPDAKLDPFDDALFHWMAATSPARDRYLSACGRRIAFDATPKLPGDGREGEPVRDWPPVIMMSDDVKRLVDQRWDEYGLRGRSGR